MHRIYISIEQKRETLTRVLLQELREYQAALDLLTYSDEISQDLYQDLEQVIYDKMEIPEVKIQTLWEIPDDNTVEFGLGNEGSVCLDWFYNCISDCVEGKITTEAFLLKLKEIRDFYNCTDEN
jgi:hypothetical protein